MEQLSLELMVRVDLEINLKEKTSISNLQYELANNWIASFDDDVN